MLQKFLNILTSLRLTVICLVLALGLVFIGTLAQVSWGLYIVQEKYFNSWFVLWQPKGWDWHLPIWPGGFLIGSALLINLLAAHIKRFEFSRKKLGIFVIHAGLILLLLGQLFTQLFQVESYMTIPEGESRNYSESQRSNELAVIDKSDPESDLVVAIPEKQLAHHREISHEKLPFKVRVLKYFQNSNPRVGSGKISYEQRPIALAMSEQDFPAATIEIETDEGVKGPYDLSRWTGDRVGQRVLEKNFGNSFATPPSFTHKGRQYEVTLRPVRYYKNHYLHLLDFKHDRYKGTDKPKNFSSRVRLTRADTKEDREVLIYMNNPLRYAGETYYQGSFEPGDLVTILQVVRNPSWVTPYIACTLVGVGLLIQFLSHLIKFSRKKTA